jgi:hypothetical protein
MSDACSYACGLTEDPELMCPECRAEFDQSLQGAAQADIERLKARIGELAREDAVLRRRHDGCRSDDQALSLLQEAVSENRRLVQERDTLREGWVEAAELLREVAANPMKTVENADFWKRVEAVLLKYNGGYLTGDPGDEVESGAQNDR